MFNLDSHGIREMFAILAMGDLELYTDKEYLVSEAYKMLDICTDNEETSNKKTNKTTFRQKNSTTTTISTFPQSNVRLLPENRVNIETLVNYIGKTIEGKFFLCRCITLPLALPNKSSAALMIVVDDPEGKQAVRLTLYNYTNAKNNLEKLFPVGMVLAIKNPWLKLTMDGGLSVKCINPAEVVVVDPEVLPILLGAGQEWSGEIPLSYGNRRYDEGLKSKGNLHFNKKRFSKAIEYYTLALSISPKNIDLLLSRAASYINVGCYNKALLDTTTILKIDALNVKGIFCHITSLWGLNRYEDALKFVCEKQKDDKILTGKKLLSEIKEKASKLLHQHKTGEFNIVEYLKAEKEHKLLEEAAEYTGPIQLKSIRRKGRGFVATETINPGQLIISSKSFAQYNFGQFSSDLNSSQLQINYETTTGHAELVDLIAQKLTVDPDLGKQFYLLFGGPELGSLSKKNPGALKQIDMQRIKQIVTFNAFSNYENSLIVDQKKTTGIWLRPSYINHSCSESNCSWQICGDIMFIRAIKQIEKGEEILISYIPTWWPFDKRQQLFQSKFFNCQCSLCQLEMKESKAIHAKREKIIQTLSELSNTTGGELDVKGIMTNIKELQSLRKITPELNLSFGHPVMTKIAFILYNNRDFQQCVELSEKMHSVMENSSLVLKAVKTCIKMIECFINQKDGKRKVKNQAQILQHDIKVAFGSVQCTGQVMNVVDSEVFKALELLGWHEFL